MMVKAMAAFITISDGVWSNSLEISHPYNGELLEDLWQDKIRMATNMQKYFLRTTIFQVEWCIGMKINEATDGSIPFEISKT